MIALFFVTSIGAEQGFRNFYHHFEEIGGAIVESYRNYGQYSSFGIHSSANYIMKTSIVSGMFFANHTQQKAGNGEKSNNTHISIYFNTGYIFKNKISLLAHGGYSYFHHSGYHGFKMPPLSLGFTTQKSFFNERLQVEASIRDVLNIRYKTTYNTHANDFILNQTVEKRTLPLEIVMRLRVGSFKVKPIRQVRTGAIIDNI